VVSDLVRTFTKTLSINCFQYVGLHTYKKLQEPERVWNKLRRPNQFDYRKKQYRKIDPFGGDCHLRKPGGCIADLSIVGP
jgi:hypothetical protein